MSQRFLCLSYVVENFLHDVFVMHSLMLIISQGAISGEEPGLPGA